MKPTRIAAALLLTLPLACGGGGGGGESTTATPAAGGPSSAPVAGGQGEPTTVLPSSMRVDLEGRRVFLPNEGWLTEAEFWRIYYEEPQRLPADLDFEALIKLGYPTEPVGNTPG